MIVNLTSDLEDLVRRKLRNGQFGSESEVVGEALRLLGERDRLETWDKDEVRRAIAAGIASLQAGHGVDGESVFERLNADLGDA
ncbi:type II toxin-antitoxin system ParD family antitoxin [Beijerinckia sp. L45]|uniref:ribbon-helix-helix domain-containing protein n=1 Tax=Beijerinckia sp. L45 TaxID=1641855 RepID=UPI00131A83C1|nr:type II toxin-antitoxin system ParD family antitoxin [Beijerinckia sp. L45]